MKTKRMTTTEFYKNPSKAIRLVKEGGKVYLAYKGLKDPIAVVQPYDKEDSGTKSERVKYRLDFVKKNQFKSKIWKSGLDLQKAVRQ